MQDGVLDAADVLVHRHPVIHVVRVEGLRVITGGSEAVEIPGRANEGVQRVGFSFRGPITFWARCVCEFL